MAHVDTAATNINWGEMMSQIMIEESRLQQLLEDAVAQGAKIGVREALDNLVLYNLGDACKQLSMSYNTLQKRIREGKIKAVDGRITGGEIRRYLTKTTIS